MSGLEFASGFYSAENAREDYGSTQPSVEDVFSRTVSHRLHLSTRWTGALLQGQFIPRYVGCWFIAPVLEDGTSDWPNATEYRVACTLSLVEDGAVYFIAQNSTDTSVVLRGKGTVVNSQGALVWDYNATNPIRNGSVLMTQWNASRLLTINDTPESSLAVLNGKDALFWNCASLVNEVKTSDEEVSTVLIVDHAGSVYSSLTLSNGTLPPTMSFVEGDDSLNLLLSVQVITALLCSCAIDVATGRLARSYATNVDRYMLRVDGTRVPVVGNDMVLPPSNAMVLSTNWSLASLGSVVFETMFDASVLGDSTVPYVNVFRVSGTGVEIVARATYDVSLTLLQISLLYNGSLLSSAVSLPFLSQTYKLDLFLRYSEATRTTQLALYVYAVDDTPLASITPSRRFAIGLINQLSVGEYSSASGSGSFTLHYVTARTA